MIFLFHRPEFVLFFALVFALHWAAPRRIRNPFLLAASYAFYASWDWRFLFCVWASTLIDYGCGLALERLDRPRQRRLVLTASVVANLGMLCFFKYLGFFIESFAALAGALGAEIDLPTLHVILPLGISFYTFQTLSYTIDIYRRRITPTRNLVDFALFVAFFPQLIAGPIEKARDLLPQIIADKRLRDVNWREGLFLFAQGWALKVILADPAGQIVHDVFEQTDPSGLTVLLGLYAVAIQVYGDFAGYTRMARGTGLLLGVRLSPNFDQPFFAKGYVDFYKRWHITLSSWIGEYVYRPLFWSLQRSRMLRWVPSTRLRLWLSAAVALFMTRMAFALWHGADVTFLALGLFIYAAQMISAGIRPLLGPVTRNAGLGQQVTRGLQILLTIHLFCIAMLFFRADSLSQAWSFLNALVSGLGTLQEQVLLNLPYFAATVGFFALYELVEYAKSNPYWIMQRGYYLNAAYYVSLYFFYRQCSGVGATEFVYFRF